MLFSKLIKKLGTDINKYEELVKEAKLLNDKTNTLLHIIENREKSINKLIEEKTIGFPWLSEAIAEFFNYKDYELALYLDTKSHPAHMEAERTRNLSNEMMVLRKQFLIAMNKVKQYEYILDSINPVYLDSGVNDLIELLKDIEDFKTNTNDDNYDSIKAYLSPEEYKCLSPSDRNQLALDRYKGRKKNRFEIGRDYERYIGYLFEKEGFKVEYTGILFGLNDLGIDLICKNAKQTLLVQCKNWSRHKEIHENVINQLYGTTVKYFIDNKYCNNLGEQQHNFQNILLSGELKAILVTSTLLSDTARDFAETLGIQYVEDEVIDEKYPSIKCNISSKNGKIYHLPMDQQYDTTVISKPGEFYAYTVKEAEDAGFQRAHRWLGNTDN